MSGTTDPIIDACEQAFPTWKGDCSGFAKAVASTLGLTLTGLADNIVDALRGGGGVWTPLADRNAAIAAAAAGQFVMAGLKGHEQTVPDPHGHVVVVVNHQRPGDVYPRAYWGSLGGTPGHDQTLNWAWIRQDRDRVSYAAIDLPTPA